MHGHTAVKISFVICQVSAPSYHLHNWTLLKTDTLSVLFLYNNCKSQRVIGTIYPYSFIFPLSIVMSIVLLLPLGSFA